MKIGERLRAAIDSAGPVVLWVLVAVAVLVAAFGTFVMVDFTTGELVLNAHPDLEAQTPWLFVVAITVAMASGASALLRSSDETWRSWQLRIGLPVIFMAIVIFLVANAQATSLDYLYHTDEGVFMRPAFPYVRAVFAAFALVGQFALLIRLRGR